METSVCTALFSDSTHHWRFSSKKVLVLRQHCSEKQQQQSHKGVLSNRPTLTSWSISCVFTWIPELHFPATRHLLGPSSWVVSSQVTWDFPTSYTAASTGRLHTAWPPGMPVWLSHFLASNPPVCSQGLRIKSKSHAWPNHCFPLPHPPTPGPPPLHAHNADVSEPLDPQALSATHIALSLPFSKNSPGRQFPPPTWEEVYTPSLPVPHLPPQKSISEESCFGSISPLH